MEYPARKRTETYVTARYQHSAWQLLASRRAPLVLGCLYTLFEHAHDGIELEDALQALTEILGQYLNYDDYRIDPENIPQQAHRELREWIKRTLIVERKGRLYATDALEAAMRFVDGLDNRIMTSTASRLSVVQREIENLENGLNPNPASRIANLKEKIARLQQELDEAERGHIPTLDPDTAVEGIREVYNLATGLRSDFRRVEDSWRLADRELRHSIISEQYHRGEIVDRLLDGHDDLLSTPEGRVFDGFQQQLQRSDELDRMKERLRRIIAHPSITQALTASQRNELRWLVLRLVKESQSVFQARARSERDVKGFLKTGLAAEHHRVGQLLSEILHNALELDWSKQQTRRQATPLPPIAVAVSKLPLIERLRFKSVEDDPNQALDLGIQDDNLEQLDDDFWDAFAGLDRAALIEQTLETLAAEGRPLSIAELAQQLPPSHDLETFALWLGMAREASLEIDEQRSEQIELVDEQERRWRFSLPYTRLDGESLNNIEWEL